VQDSTQEGIVDVDVAVIFDKTQFPEFIHKQVDPTSRCANQGDIFPVPTIEIPC